MIVKNKKIIEMCKDLNFSKGKLTDEYLFTLDAVDIFYYKKNIGQVDIKTSFTDGPNDGGIDYIYVDNDTMYLIQGKSSEQITFDEIRNAFFKMITTIEKFEEKNMIIIPRF